MPQYIVLSIHRAYFLWKSGGKNRVLHQVMPNKVKLDGIVCMNTFSGGKKKAVWCVNRIQDKCWLLINWLKYRLHVHQRHILINAGVTQVCSNSELHKIWAAYSKYHPMMNAEGTAGSVNAKSSFQHQSYLRLYVTGQVQPSKVSCIVSEQHPNAEWLEGVSFLQTCTSCELGEVLACTYQTVHSTYH